MSNSSQHTIDPRWNGAHDESGDHRMRTEASNGDGAFETAVPFGPRLSHAHNGSAPTPVALAGGTPPAPRASLATLDAFRMLALVVDEAMTASGINSLVVMSAEPGDGRSLAAQLLAAALADLRPAVRLVDADPFSHTALRRRDRSRQFRPTRWRHGRALVLPPAGDERGSPDQGSSSCLPGYVRIPVAQQICSSQGAFVRAVQLVLDAEVAKGATVIIDVPACSVSSLPFAIARIADAALYVVRPGTKAAESHRDIVAQSAVLGIRLLGSVLNEG
jgi:hypothetical protein